jgi:hypothetical protein
MDRLIKVIKRKIGKQLGIKLHTQGYCYAAIGIRRVKVKELFSRGY